MKYYIRVLYRVIYYLYFAIDYRLYFNSDEQTLLIVYSDTDYISDKINRKNILNITDILDRAAIFWLSKKQNSVSILTTKSEYILMFITVKQGQ